MPRGRPNRSGVDWSDPAAVAEYKRKNARHHEYNRKYSKEHPKPYKPRPEPYQKRGGPSLGERNGNALLAADDVRAIRALSNTRMLHGISLWTQKQLAALFGVSVQTIQQIIYRKTWKDVD